ncbi:MAG TPA: hypothetical protein PKC23_03385 [Candidatus Desulfobacillus sp.]|nr:hypothetical protein [Candidatus Desulfobacillus sp.]
MNGNAWILAAAVLLASACAHLATDGLLPGVASEADVRARLGEPGMSWSEPDGGKLLEYSGQPNGTFCRMIVIGPDGKLREIRDAFTAENFARVLPGLGEDEVRRLLGAPQEIVRFDLKPDEEVWSWLVGETSEKYEYFNVYFGRDRRLLRSNRSVIYKASGPGME